MKKLFINGREVKGIGFVYDGCHKIYILEDMNDYSNVLDVWGDDELLYGLEELEYVYNKSCGLRFISTWKLEDKNRIVYAEQCEDAVFEWKEV